MEEVAGLLHCPGKVKAWDFIFQFGFIPPRTSSPPNTWTVVFPSSSALQRALDHLLWWSDHGERPPATSLAPATCTAAATLLTRREEREWEAGPARARRLAGSANLSSWREARQRKPSRGAGARSTRIQAQIRPSAALDADSAADPDPPAQATRVERTGGRPSRRLGSDQPSGPGAARDQAGPAQRLEEREPDCHVAVIRPLRRSNLDSEPFIGPDL